ncbi:unnamed protein product [Orchesella dallaii]|uniref:Uncharacterized protein n=1 Tax=Orchesella dallaii TaxID=48710 RepID=A0ABP1RB08_9HEXA
MASTVYLVDRGNVLCPRYRPFDLRGVNSGMFYSFRSYDITSIPINQNIVSTNDKLCPFAITILFKDMCPGRQTSIRVLGPFLEKFKDVYEDFNTLKLNLTFKYPTKSWSIAAGSTSAVENQFVCPVSEISLREKFFIGMKTCPPNNIAIICVNHEAKNMLGDSKRQVEDEHVMAYRKKNVERDLLCHKYSQQNDEEEAQALSKFQLEPGAMFCKGSNAKRVPCHEHGQSFRSKLKLCRNLSDHLRQ